MVSNKDMISELKKYNSDLEKHVPGLDLDLMKESNLYNISKNDDYFTLFAENLVDLRTEIALMRKNLSADVEGMVLRVVNEQQNMFSKRMNDFFVRAILDVKETWDTRLSSFTDEVSEIKKGFNEMKIQNENSNNMLKDINEEIMLLKASTTDSKRNNEEYKNLENKISILESLMKRLILNSERTNDLDKKINYVDQKVLSFNTDKLESSFNKKINEIESHMDNLFLENTKLKNSLDETPINNKLKDLQMSIETLKNSSSKYITPINNVNNRITQLENHITNISKSIGDKNHELENHLTNISRGIADKNIEIENKIDLFTQSVNEKNNKFDDNLKTLNNKVIDTVNRDRDVIKNIEIIQSEKIVQNKTPILEIKDKMIKSTVTTKKLLEIDSRLRKLNSLR